MGWYESGKNWLESTKNLIPFQRNWYESNKNKKFPESDENCHESGKSMNVISVMSPKNWYESCKDMSSLFGKSKSWVEEEVRAKGISDEHRDLLIKGSGALLLAPSISYKDGLGSACRFLFSYAAASDNNCCKMAKDKLEKSKSWAEGEIRSKGINVENLDLLIKAGGTLLISPVVGYYYGIGGACGFILKCAASNENCREMAINRFEKTKSWVGMAKNGFEMSKSWAEEKVRASGISDEHRDLVVKGGGALLLAVAMGHYGGGLLGGACGYMFRSGSSNDNEKFMKAPGRPGEFIARAAFEANTRDYFRDLRGKHP